MDIFKRLEDSQDKNNILYEQLAKVLQQLIELLSNITEFSENELKAISMLETDEQLAEMLGFYIKNKKHIKRKHSKEILECLKYIAQILSSIGNLNHNEGNRNDLH